VCRPSGRAFAEIYRRGQRAVWWPIHEFVRPSSEPELWTKWWRWPTKHPPRTRREPTSLTEALLTTTSSDLLRAILVVGDVRWAWLDQRYRPDWTSFGRCQVDDRLNLEEVIAWRIDDTADLPATNCLVPNLRFITVDWVVSDIIDLMGDHVTDIKNVQISTDTCKKNSPILKMQLYFELRRQTDTKQSLSTLV